MMTPDSLPTQPAEILVIDDTPVNLRLLVKILQEEGYIVRPAKNGQSGINAARSAPPDVILLDIMMPDIDGFEVCRQLKADASTRDIPIIFITALDNLSDKVKGFASGGVDYITKPFQEEEVLARVRAHVIIRRLQRDLQKENARFRALEEAAFEGIFLHEHGRILEVNTKLCEMFGYSREEFLGRPVLDFVPASSREYLQTQELQNGLPHETRGLKRTGEVFPLRFQGRHLTYQGCDVRVVAVHDLSLQRRLEQKNRTFENALAGISRLGRLVGKSAAMRQVFDQIINAASTEYSVIITGESGTGKELAAQTIHELSARKEQKFIPVNCGAISEQLFEREFFGHRKGAFTGAERACPGFLDVAHGGTLFLDEVGELSPAMQIKLLRVLESHEYTPIGGTTPKHADIRVLAATNQDLESLRRKGAIRDDFFYRLHVVEIHLPPLREHRDDIPLLVKHSIEQERLKKTPPSLSAAQIARLVHYDWPGNVRELRNVLQSYLTTGQLAIPGTEETETPDTLSESVGLLQAVEAYEKQIILTALQQNSGNKSAAAATLQISRRALYNKLGKYGIETM